MEENEDNGGRERKKRLRGGQKKAEDNDEKSKHEELLYSDRNKKTFPDMIDVMEAARLIWKRDPKKARAMSTEDRAFREHFGCSPMVIPSLWNMLQINELLPTKDHELKHLLWALYFMKVYPKDGPLSTALSADPKTIRRYVWPMIEAIAELELLVVSSCPNLNYLQTNN